MQKKIFFLLIISLPLFSMQPVEIPDPEQAIVEWPIGRPIPSTTYLHAQYSKEHTFEIGEIVAIPKSTIFGTKEDLVNHYGKVIALEQKDITVRFVRNSPLIVNNENDEKKMILARFLSDMTMKYPELLGKFPLDILKEILKEQK